MDKHMKHIAIASALFLSHSCVFAQGAAPLNGNVSFVAEYSRDVSLGSSDKNTWSGFAPVNLTWSRTGEGVEVIAGTTSSALIDTSTYLHYTLPAGTTQLTKTVSQSSTREGKKLEPGASWKADRTYTTVPVTYCHSDDHKVDSKFEVAPREPYTLILDGKETTIEVTPVVERGWWTRCYSGKRYTRLLVAMDLGAVVSIEHIGFTPQGQAHSSSYRLNVKEIKKQ
jgi:hypothetical protein